MMEKQMESTRDYRDYMGSYRDDIGVYGLL